MRKYTCPRCNEKESTQSGRNFRACIMDISEDIRGGARIWRSWDTTITKKPKEKKYNWIYQNGTNYTLLSMSKSWKN